MFSAVFTPLFKASENSMLLVILLSYSSTKFVEVREHIHHCFVDAICEKKLFHGFMKAIAKSACASSSGKLKLIALIINVTFRPSSFVGIYAIYLQNISKLQEDFAPRQGNLFCQMLIVKLVFVVL